MKMMDIEKFANIDIFKDSGRYLLISDEMQDLHEYAMHMLTINLSISEEHHPKGSVEYGHIKETHDEYRDFYMPSTVLMLLYIFFEKTLRTICYSITNNSSFYQIPKGKKFPIDNDGNTFIDKALNYLKDECRLNIKLTKEHSNYIHSIRKIRNDYAHGNWDNVKEQLIRLNLVTAFRIVTEILDSIRDQDYENKNIK
tara:strand:+ start:59 stop:652 length:594 start_codon:yes stop_codon:yes gene_type:complete